MSYKAAKKLGSAIATAGFAVAAALLFIHGHETAGIWFTVFALLA